MKRLDVLTAVDTAQNHVGLVHLVLCSCEVAAKAEADDRVSDGALHAEVVEKAGRRLIEGA